MNWTCYVEPLATAGLPGGIHLRLLTLADLYTRFMTMRGFDVAVSRGWACHGLGVEIAVARELGLTSRLAVEEFGLEAFADRCRESARRHAALLASLDERLGGGAGQDRAYRTMDRGYIESVWWSLRQFFDAKMLVLDERAAPYCSRCETILADHELRGPGVYRPVTGTAMIVRLRPTRPDADLLIWTPEPWTLAGNVAVAVHPDETYVIGKRAGRDERVVVAEDAFARALGEGWHVVGRFPGAELAGASYQPVFRLAGASCGRVLADRSVEVGRGTGLLPLAPAFDGGRGVSGKLPVVDPVGADGRFGQSVSGLAGLLATDADPAIAADLADRGLLFAARPQERRRPHCWRCGSRLFSRLGSSWYLGLSGVAGRLRAGSERVSWHPAGAQPPGGRGWPDWAVSRSRYWGAPMPIWTCEHGHLTCVSSLTELSELAGRDLLGIDPHRPVIDGIEIGCRTCGARAKRVPDIVDAAYDAGAMPFAQFGAPMRRRADFDSAGPADLLIASGAKLRGWHYGLAVGSLVLGRSPVANGLRCGDVLDSRGRPMSGQAGNVSEPFPLIERHGADAIRWFFAARTRPDVAVQVTDRGVDLARRRGLDKIANCAALFSRHAAAAAGAGEPGAALAAHRPVLDRWLLSELQATIAAVTTALDAYRPDTATRRIERFTDDLSTWWVRRSRTRIAGHDGSGPQSAALAVLRIALETVSRLMAPFAPDRSDQVWQLIRGRDAPDSVHLACWPQPESALIDDRLRHQMLLARRVARAGRAARAAAGTGLRQPLARARVGASAFSALDCELRALVAADLNVRSIERLPAGEDPGACSPGWVVAGRPGSRYAVALEVAVTAELRLEGLAWRAIRVIQAGRRRAGFCPGQQIAVGYRSLDQEVEAALTEYGQLISRRVRAARYEPALAGGPDSFEQADDRLAATFWLTPTSRPSDGPDSRPRRGS